jgi:hypothetical protein
MLMIDFSGSAYEDTDGSAQGGTFRCHAGKISFSLESGLSGPGHEKLVFQFKQCVGSYLSFMRDPSRFLRLTPYTCLFDRQSGAYALLWAVSKTRLFWLVLKPSGQVFISCATFDEAEKEVKKWTFVTKPPGSAATPVPTDSSPFMPEAVSLEAFGAFLLFFEKQKGRYEFLFKNSMDMYGGMVTPLHEMPDRERALRNEASPLLRIDYTACAYEPFESAMPGGNFTRADDSSGFRVTAPVSEEWNSELEFQFRECISHYFAFVENPLGFLRYRAYSSLFDKQSGGYALFTAEGKKGMVWHFLKHNGQVFSSLLNMPESEKEAGKLQYVVEMPDERNIEVTESKPYRPKLYSFELFQSFYKFINLHKKHYDSLFNAAAKKYKDIVSLPPRRTPVPRDTDKLLFYARDERK